MAQPSPSEQYILEMINRGRLNPQAEADSFGIDLNDGLSANTITSDPKQPLAFNPLLIDSSRAHSQWMLDTNTFSHTGINGTSSNQRMRDAGYQFTGSWRSGENIAYKGTGGTVNVTAFSEGVYENLFRSSGHRKNTLKPDFREVGVAATEGEFTSGNTFNALMVTENFAKSGSNIFLTGVAYDDLTIDDDFYTVDEGLGGIEVTAIDTANGNSYNTETMMAGGYHMALPSGTYDVSFSDNGQLIGSSSEVMIGSENIKLDLDTSDLPLSPSVMTEQMGEVGVVSDLNRLKQTIQLDNTYTNPVVFAMPLSYNGSDPAIARITDTQSDNFSIILQEPEYEDGGHTKESFSYLVLEAGMWELEDGTLLEVGSLDTNDITTSAWESIDFSSDFQQDPVVLSQTQTKNGSQFVRTRQKASSVDGFELSLEEEEALKSSGHVTETVGWLAIEPSSGSWDGLDYEAVSTEPNINHSWDTISFGQTFDEMPNLLSSLSSFNGGDPSGLRYRNLGMSDVQMKVEEDRSLDNEIGHVRETVDFLAIAGSGNLSAVI